MTTNDSPPSNVTIVPVTPQHWPALEVLFGPRGACAGCWCMYWRQPRSEFDSLKGDPNRALLKTLIEDGGMPGLLAYVDGKPAGWISLGPRQEFGTLQRSRILKPVDDQPVWSVVCFFVAKGYRRQGLTGRLLQAAIEYARGQGAQILEAYPEEPTQAKAPEVFLFTGIASVFLKAGFSEVARRSPHRPIMRYFM